MNRRITIVKRAILFAFSVVVFCTSLSRLSAQTMYWEDPVRITKGDARFPRVATDGTKSCVFWQEIDTRNETIWLSCEYTDARGVQRTNSRFAGPFPYSGRIPDIYSVALSKKGTLAVAVLSGTKSLSIFVSTDGGAYFTEAKIPRYTEPFVAPQIYATCL